MFLAQNFCCLDIWADSRMAGKKSKFSCFVIEVLSKLENSFTFPFQFLNLNTHFSSTNEKFRQSEYTIWKFTARITRWRKYFSFLLLKKTNHNSGIVEFSSQDEQLQISAIRSSAMRKKWWTEVPTIRHFFFICSGIQV